MKKKRLIVISSVLGLAAAVFSVGWLMGNAGLEMKIVHKAQASGGVVKNPTGTAPDRYVYYPGITLLFISAL